MNCACGESRTALAVARVLDASEGQADVLAEVDALVDEVEVGREGRVHDRARKRGLRGRVEETARGGPCARRECGRLVNLHV